MYLFSGKYSITLGSIQPPVLCIRGEEVLSEGINRLGHEADNSTPVRADVNNARSCISIPPYAFKTCRETAGPLQLIARFGR